MSPFTPAPSLPLVLDPTATATATLQKKPWLSAPLDFKWSLDKPLEVGCYGILGCSAWAGDLAAFFLSKAMKCPKAKRSAFGVGGAGVERLKLHPLGTD